MSYSPGEQDKEERWAEVQKKITPWRLGVQEQEPELKLVPAQRAAKLGKRHGTLLVVASLIDKPTNLGGVKHPVWFCLWITVFQALPHILCCINSWIMLIQSILAVLYVLGRCPAGRLTSAQVPSVLQPLQCSPQYNAATLMFSCTYMKDTLFRFWLVAAAVVVFVPGLCRTCEIFGASGLVLDSLHHLNDKHFQSLSVSSELWLPLLEVNCGKWP